MSDNLSEQRLQDYVDGLLPPDEAAELEDALAEAPEARATVELLRSLRREAGALPSSIAPPRDLWPDIRARMAPAPLAPVEARVEPRGGPAEAASAGTAATPWWPRLAARQWAALAAAAMVLVVTSSALTAWIVGTSPAGDNPPAEAAGVVLEGMPSIEVRYASQIEQLQLVLDQNRDALDPDTVSTIETNLRVIDRAIRSAQEALQEDPLDAGLSRMLDSNYRHKLQLLQRANRFIEMS